jgi:membrane associated rhomboid family serine protease
MLPIQDVLPSRSRPWITTAIVAALATTYGVQILLDPAEVRRLIFTYALLPAQWSWPALFSSLLVSRGVIDAATGVLALWVFGDNVEDRLGRLRYLILAVGAGAVSALLAARMSVDMPGGYIAGPSGLAGAVIGAHLVLVPRSKILVLVPGGRGVDLVELPAPLVTLMWLTIAGAIGTAVATIPGNVTVAVLHQLAGLVVGAAAARLLVRRERLRCEWWNVPRVRYSPDRRRTSRDTSASSVSNASS